MVSDPFQPGDLVLLRPGHEILGIVVETTNRFYEGYRLHEVLWEDGLKTTEMSLHLTHVQSLSSAPNLGGR